MDEANPAASSIPSIPNPSQTVELLQGVLGQDPVAADALYERIAPALSAWVWNRVCIHFRGQVDGDELVSEIWIRIVETLPRYDTSKGNFRPWLFTVAKFVSFEMLRNLRRQPLSCGGDEEGGVLDRSSDESKRLTKILLKDEMVNLFRQRFDAMPSGEQELLIHMGLEERTAKDTAALLSKSVASVEKSWQRLQAKIQQDVVLKRAVYFD
ncbi:MAG: sigma-70 family RNA polymerase sigma factor [Planctomycetes bacterium]|nr:sigma-70 family RNA polymerase sigma factor [Planctomycetota bacterium]